MSILEVFIPTADSRIQKLPLAPRLDRLAGRRIGWLDNQKANANQLLLETVDSLKQLGTEFEMVVLTKNATAPAPDPVMDHLETCDAVVLAIAD